MIIGQDLVKYLRYTSPAHIYATAMSPPAVQQVISALKVILGEDNSDRGLQTPCFHYLVLSNVTDTLMMLDVVNFAILQGPRSWHKCVRTATSLGMSFVKWVVKCWVMRAHQWCQSCFITLGRYQLSLASASSEMYALLSLFFGSSCVFYLQYWWATYKALPQLRHPGIAEVLMQLSGLLCHWKDSRMD